MTATTTSLRTVLMATDFSPNAEIAGDWATAIAAAHGARLILVHGVTLPGQVTDYLPSPPDIREEIRHAAAAKLDETANRLRSDDLDVTTDLEIGIPSQSILAAAEEHSADLVVVGTRGLSGIEHLLLGSTAERIVQRAKCPVLSVHPKDQNRKEGVRSILVPTDFSEDAMPAIDAALQLLAVQPDSTRLTLLHAYHLPFEYTAYGTVPTSWDFLKDAGGAADESLKEMAGKLRRDKLTVETRAVEGYPPDVIVDVAREIDCDLIAMGTHGRTGIAHLLLGSTAERVVQHAGCPVLTVQRQRTD